MKKSLIALLLLIVFCAPALAEDVPEGPLVGRVIGIDPGHQRKADARREPIGPGARTTKYRCSEGTWGRESGVGEYKVVLAYGLALRDALTSRGATVVMARETNDVSISNAERTKMFNAVGADLAIHLHCDAATSRAPHGATMYYPNTRYVSKETSVLSKHAGKFIFDRMLAKTGAMSRGLRATSTFTTLNYADMPSLLFEMGFLTNAKEERRLLNAQYQQLVIDAIVEGMEAYFVALDAAFPAFEAVGPVDYVIGDLPE